MTLTHSKDNWPWYIYQQFSKRCQDLLGSLMSSHQHIFHLSFVTQQAGVLPQSTKLPQQPQKLQYLTLIFPLCPLSPRVNNAAVTNTYTKI